MQKALSSLFPSMNCVLESSQEIPHGLPRLRFPDHTDYLSFFWLPAKYANVRVILRITFQSMGQSNTLNMFQLYTELGTFAIKYDCLFMYRDLTRWDNSERKEKIIIYIYIYCEEFTFVRCPSVFPLYDKRSCERNEIFRHF